VLQVKTTNFEIAKDGVLTIHVKVFGHPKDFAGDSPKLHFIFWFNDDNDFIVSFGESKNIIGTVIDDHANVERPSWTVALLRCLLGQKRLRLLISMNRNPPKEQIMNFDEAGLQFFNMVRGRISMDIAERRMVMGAAKRPRLEASHEQNENRMV
jgi:hypothetical protein